MSNINVLGLGDSLKLFEGGTSIGVNDIWSRHKTDYIVCVDRKDRFTPERLKTINESSPLKFYSQLSDWDDRRDFEKIELQIDYPNYVCQLNIKTIPKSFCSPFIACAIAYKYLEATEINVYGVDLINHPLLKADQCEKIKIHFRNLKTALRQNGCELIIHGNGILKVLNNVK